MFDFRLIYQVLLSLETLVWSIFGEFDFSDFEMESVGKCILFSRIDLVLVIKVSDLKLAFSWSVGSLIMIFCDNYD